MTVNAAKKITYLRQQDFKNWIVALWLVKRRLVEKAAHYRVLRVETDRKLELKLRAAVTGKTQSKSYKLEPYDFLTADQDDQILTIKSSETEFVSIQTEIDKGLANTKVEKYGDLLYKINGDKSVAVSKTYRLSKDFSKCPTGVKVLLLGAGGVLVISQYSGQSFWEQWAPLPSRAD